MIPILAALVNLSTLALPSIVLWELSVFIRQTAAHARPSASPKFAPISTDLDAPSPSGELERRHDRMAARIRSYPLDLSWVGAPLTALYPPHQLRTATSSTRVSLRPLTPEDEAAMAEFLARETGDEEF